MAEIPYSNKEYEKLTSHGKTKHKTKTRIPKHSFSIRNLLKFEEDLEDNNEYIKQEIEELESSEKDPYELKPSVKDTSVFGSSEKGSNDLRISETGSNELNRFEKEIQGEVEKYVSNEPFKSSFNKQNTLNKPYFDQDPIHKSSYERRLVETGIFEESIKQEPIEMISYEGSGNNDKQTDLSILYAEHEIKEEMVIGPVVVLERINLRDTCKPKSRERRFHCRECQQTFSTRSKLQTHKVIHAKSYPCQLCEKVFKYKARLDTHLKNRLCDVEFKTKNLIIKTLTHNTNNDDVKPEILKTTKNKTNIPKTTQNLTILQTKIPQTTDNLTNLKTELSKTTFKGDNKTEFTCDICNKSFTFIDNLRRHKYLHSDISYPCDICDKTFKQKRYLADHMRTHDEKSYRVCECGKPIANTSNLNRHKRYYCSSNTNRLTRKSKKRHATYNCDICGTVYRDKVCFINHILKHDENYKPSCRNKERVECNVCSKTFSRPRSLKLHSMIHDNIRPAHACVICDKKYSRKDQLSLHIKTYHTNKSNLVTLTCKLCSKIFSSKTHIRQHKLFCNEQVLLTKPYRCETCKKLFSDELTLVRHIALNHLNTFTCDYCKKEFGLKKKLLKHMAVHLKNKFTCNICPKKFSEKRRLTDHLMSHRGIRRYSCSNCDKTFIYDSNFSQHKKYCCKM